MGAEKEIAVLAAEQFDIAEFLDGSSVPKSDAFFKHMYADRQARSVALVVSATMKNIAVVKGGGTRGHLTECGLEGSAGLVL